MNQGSALPHVMSNLHDLDPEGFIRDAVQRLNRGVSEKFVPQPTQWQVLGDVLVGLGRFKNAVWWKYFWTERKSQSMYVADSLSSGAYSEESSDSLYDITRPYSSKEDTGGLGTRLRPLKAKQAPQASPEVEAFLREVDRALLSNVADKPVVAPSRIAAEITVLETALQKSMLVVIPTDKTNSFSILSIKDYIRIMDEHLAESSVEVLRDQILEIHFQAQHLFESLNDENGLSNNELRFIDEGLKVKVIPTPSLLIKDHKKPREDGTFPTRLVIFADNFTSVFPKLGYKGIKKIFDDHGVPYTRRTIINAQHLKESLEKLHITKHEVTIASLDVESMYPSTRFKLIQKAVDYFLKQLSREDRASIKQCLSLIKFGMGHTLCTFHGRYFEYNGVNGDSDPNERALTIGGFESAWLADLVAAYILEMTFHHF
jgi:hypothetical protein